MKFENQKLWFIHSFYKYWSFNTEVSLGSELAPLFSLHRFPGDLLQSHDFKFHLYADSQFTFLAWLLLLKPPICISNCFLDIPTQMYIPTQSIYVQKKILIFIPFYLQLFPQSTPYLLMQFLSSICSGSKRFKFLLSHSFKIHTYIWFIDKCFLTYIQGI